MRVIDIMSTTIRSVRPQTPVVEAFRVLSAHAISSLPVLDDVNRLVGIVSEQDLLRRAVAPAARPLRGAAQAAPPETVAEVMTPRPFTTGQDDDVSDLARVFSVVGWKSVPVLRHGRLVGMVSRSDVVRALSRPDADVQRDVEVALAGAGAVGSGVSVDSGVVRLAGVDTADEERCCEIARSVVGVRDVRVSTWRTA